MNSGICRKRPFRNRAADFCILPGFGDTISVAVAGKSNDAAVGGLTTRSRQVEFLWRKSRIRRAQQRVMRDVESAARLISASEGRGERTSAAARFSHTLTFTAGVLRLRTLKVLFALTSDVHFFSIGAHMPLTVKQVQLLVGAARVISTSESLPAIPHNRKTRRAKASPPLSQSQRNLEPSLPFFPPSTSSLA